MTRHLWRYGPVVVGLGACVLTLYQFDWRSMASILNTVPVVWLLSVMSIATIVVFAICACRWIAISQLPWTFAIVPRVYCYTAFVIGASIVTPLQLGELLKVKFAQESGLKIGNSAVNVALERILDLATIAGMGLSGLIYARTTSALLALATMTIVFAAGLVTPAILHFCVGRLGDTVFGNRIRSFAGGALPASRLFILGLTTLLKWGLTLLAWLLILQAVHIDLSVWQGALLVGSVTAISILSMIPGGIGVQELSVRAILVGMGIEPLNAEAAAVVLRLFTPVMVILGVAHLPFLYRKPGTSLEKETHV